MDEGIAGRLKITLGDTLTFSGDTRAFSAKVTSLRRGLGKPEAELLLYLPAGRWTASRRRLTSFRYDGDGRMLTSSTASFRRSACWTSARS